MTADPLLTLIQEYNAARVVMNAVPEGDPSEKPFWDAYKQLCEAPPIPTTLAGAVAGIQLVRDEDRDCGWQPELTENVLSAVLSYFAEAKS
ncbi:MAG: hypothetical protein KF810_17320 [Rhizobiaceae bacterium]|nr:hypothetical protein [Rhizobiaceae bacterium]